MSEQLAIDFDAAAHEDAPSLEELTGDLLGEYRGEVVGWTLDCMAWAEDAIAEAQERHPERASLLDAAFRVLCPRYELFGSRGVEHTVRAHMDELLDRIGEDGPAADLTRATAAECCAAAAEASLIAPPSHDWHIAYVCSFVDAFGRETAEGLLGAEEIKRAEDDRDRYGVKMALEELHKQARDEDRGETWAEVVDAWSVGEAA